MTISYTPIMPATDWFFVHENTGTKKTHIVHHLAAWALATDGKIVGLLPVSDSSVSSGTTAKLVTPPPIHGRYIHREKLTEEMQACL